MSGAAHCVLSLADVDELEELEHTILLNSTLIVYVLEHQQPKTPDDLQDGPMLSALREGLQMLTEEIRMASERMAGIVKRGTCSDRRKKANDEK